MSNITDNPKIQVLKAGCSGVFTNYIYKAIPLAFDESMSYYETLAGLRAYLKDVILPTVNGNAEAVAELQELYIQLNDYVTNYFDNLDVQEEINNKLDKMVEDGTIESILLNYSQVTKVFDTYSEMIFDTSTFVNGMKLKTLGYYFINDGGGADYVVTNVQNETKYQISIGTNLWIEMIIKDSVNVKQLGAYGDGENDDANIFNLIVSKFKNIFIPDGNYLINSSIVINNSNVTIKGTKNSKLILGGDGFPLIDSKAEYTTIDGITFENTNEYYPTKPSGAKEFPSQPPQKAVYLRKSHSKLINCVINKFIVGCVAGENGTNQTDFLIENNDIINLIGINTGWINDGAMSFGKYCKMKNNYVTCSTDFGIVRSGLTIDIHADNSMVSNNMVIGNENVKACIHSEASVNVIIDSNIALSPGSQGIVVSNYNTVTNNICETANHHVDGYPLIESGILAVEVSHVNISNNKIYGRYEGANGIYYSNSTGDIISNNKIIGTKIKHGIQGLNVNHSQVIGNNVLDGIRYINGIVLSNGVDNIISSNIIGYPNSEATDSRKASISTNTCDFITICDNVVNGGNWNIHVASFAHGQINNNIIKNTQGTSSYGLICQANTNEDKLIFIDNNIISNATHKYDFTNPTNTYVNDNEQLSLKDTSDNSKKIIKVTNGSIVIS